MKSNFITIILFIYYILVVLVIAETKTLYGVIIDQLPKYNDNFEPNSGGMVLGLLVPTLVNGLPELSNNKSSQMNTNAGIISPELFKFFFTSNPNQTSPGYNYLITTPYQIQLEKVEATGNYLFYSEFFYPIDNLGFDLNIENRIYRDYSVPPQYHNFHFTMKINTKFNYMGVGLITISSDDDCWVFLDNNLVLDLGGVHGIVSGKIDLTKLNLNNTQLYNLQIFYSQRKTATSSFRIDSTIDITCDNIDYCGLCYGNGSTCCDIQSICNDNNECTIDECPPSNTIIDNGKTISNYCIYKPIKTPNNLDPNCQYKCNSSNGIFDKISCSSSDSTPNKSNKMIINFNSDLLLSIIIIIISLCFI